MRDLLLILIVLGLLPLILVRPYVGILVWYWIGLMNPHRLTYGFAYTFPFAALVAATFMVSFIFSREPKRLPLTRETVVLLLFILWMLITTLFSVYPQEAWPQMEKVGKIMLFAVFTLMVMQQPSRIKQLVWVAVASIGFYALKGGVFSALTGGSHRVWGPSGSFIGGNNELGLAMNMALPLMRYLQLTFKNRWLRLAMWAAMILTVLAILGTHSRGALLGLAAMLAVLLIKSRRRFTLIAIIAVALPLTLLSMPESWWGRMDTIRTYEEDASAMQRIGTWNYILTEVVPERPILGIGFEGVRMSHAHDVHSIYFEVLSEHGVPGLVLFLLLGIFALRTATKIGRMTKGNEDLAWARDLALMIQTALVAYAVSGVFLGLAYFDLYYLLIAILVLIKVHVKEQVRGPEADMARAQRGVRRPTGAAASYGRRPALQRRAARAAQQARSRT